MTEEKKKTEEEVTDEGAVEIKDENLDQVSGGPIYMSPTPLTSTSPSLSTSPLTQKVAPTQEYVLPEKKMT